MVTIVESIEYPVQPTAIAPDGSDVRALLGSQWGGLARFDFPAGETSQAVQHRTIDEIWHILGGLGQMWLADDVAEGTVDLRSGVTVLIPVGSRFQVRTFGHEALSAVAATMPPWPGSGEARIVAGRWDPTLPAGPV